MCRMILLPSRLIFAADSCFSSTSTLNPPICLNYRFKISYSLREIGRPEILRDEHGIGSKLQKENQTDFNN